ncbi:MAG TPA: hypothetical protein VIB39_08375 [Candidatus Angelobacter sp.]|jgi:hypothetical protein
MSREEIVTIIRELAEKLGHAPSHSELSRNSKVTRRQIRKAFGTYTQALRECKLHRGGGGRKLDMASLFADWAGVVRLLKKTPTVLEYEQYGKFSIAPLRTRFRTWGMVPGALMRLAADEGWATEWADVVEIIAAEEAKAEHDEATRDKEWPSGKRRSCGPKEMLDRPVYGPPMRREPLAHGPVNEAGVLFLFGAMAEELGFIVQMVQTGCPDCEAMREVGRDRWQRVRIELEYESRNFLRHLHDANECDLIVCWEHNWPECPLEVVELRKTIGRSTASRDRSGDREIGRSEKPTG